jgi:hypothetical protein
MLDRPAWPRPRLGDPGDAEQFFLEGDAKRSQPLRGRRIAASAAVFVIAMLGVIIMAAAADSDGFLTWSQPFLLAPATLPPGAATGYSLDAVSCASTSLCVAVGGAGHLLSTTDPTAGGGAWQPSTLAAADGPDLVAISCAAPSFCAAVTDAGAVVTSSDPTVGSGDWATALIDGDTILTGVSCPSVSLCVAVDAAGDVLTSVNPTGGAAAWKATPVDPVNAPLNGVACASPSLCVAVDAYGDIVATTDPTGGQEAWQIAEVDGAHSFTGPVTCPSPTLCVAIDDAGNAVSSTNPAGGAGSWHVASVLGPSLLTGLACASPSFCGAVDDTGNVLQSQSPTADSPPWVAAKIDPIGADMAITCASPLLCVVVDNRGNAIIGAGTQTTEQLSVSLGGTGQGAITGAMISCPVTCAASYPAGTSATLTATPSLGSTFVGWDGACSGTGPCTLTMSSAMSASAIFDLVPPPTAFLTVALGGLGTGSVVGGGLTCPSTCRLSEPAGSRVSLTARPGPNSVFAGWSAAGCQAEGPCVVTMNGDMSVAADFARQGSPLPAKLGATVYRVVVSRRLQHARFYFHLTGSDARAQCSFTVVPHAVRGMRPTSRRKYASCRSPILYERAAGRYIFAVRARRDVGSAVSPPAERTVDV